MADTPALPLSFTLNGEAVSIDVDPARRLLDVLRYELGLPGSKEGCAEGECGACTVCIDGLPAVSCLVPAYQVRGRHVETIESLDPGRLDPYLAGGATQCGACTPGVVMTAEWIVDHPEILETHTVRELMAGNLCRCTGYDGIVDSVEDALRRPRASRVPEKEAPRATGVSPGPPEEALPRLAKSSGAPRAGGGDGATSTFLPSTVSEACELLAAHPGAVPIAGGTDLLVHWPQRHDLHRQTFVDLSGVEELQPLRWTDDELILGGLTTYWDVIRDVRTRDEFPLLVEAGRQVGGIQIQARGTWAGNIVNASPAADGVPVLMAYDAVVVLTSAEGEEEIPLSEFYLGYKEMRRRPDQLITAIRLPRRRYTFQIFEKVGPRRAQAITKLGVAVTAFDGEWRVVANSVAPTVRRCRAVEKLLAEEAPVGGPDDLLPALRQDISPIDDIRSTAEYRERVLARLLYYDLRDVCPAFRGTVGV